MRRRLFKFINTSLLITLSIGISYSQALNFGCESGAQGTSEYVPTFDINLSSNPSAIANQPIVIPSSGYGECCGHGNNINCFVLAVTLNPGAQGI